MALDTIVRTCSSLSEGNTSTYDIAISDGVIVGLAPEILEPSKTEINARGLHAFPGTVDAHVHFNEPGHEDWEGITTGSAALLAGGGTSFIDMPLNSLPVTTNAKNFNLKLAAIKNKGHADFALWAGLVPENILDLPELAALGVVGFKAFMSNSGLPEFHAANDNTLLEGMRMAASLGLPVAVHAESENISSVLTKQLQANNKTSIKDYLASRPVVSELEAINRAIFFAEFTGCALQIVHVSSGRGVALVMAAKQRGVDVTVETCPHYLAFTEDDLETLGTTLKCAPPLRDQQTQNELWQAVLAGNIDTIGSDHSPAPAALKTNANFFKVWGGIAGVQSTLAVMLTEGWQNRKLALETIAKMLAQNPAKRFGLKQKGELVVGKDADIALVNLNTNYKLSADDLFYLHKQSPYISKNFCGVVQQVLLRGQSVFKDKKIVGPAIGKFISVK